MPERIECEKKSAISIHLHLPFTFNLSFHLSILVVNVLFDQDVWDRTRQTHGTKHHLCEDEAMKITPLHYTSRHCSDDRSTTKSWRPVTATFRLELPAGRRSDQEPCNT